MLLDLRLKLWKRVPFGEVLCIFSQVEVTGVFVMIGSGRAYALHHPKFRVDDRVLFPTAYYLYELAKEFLAK